MVARLPLPADLRLFVTTLTGVAELWPDPDRVAASTVMETVDREVLFYGPPERGA